MEAIAWVRLKYISPFCVPGGIFSVIPALSFNATIGEVMTDSDLVYWRVKEDL